MALPVDGLPGLMTFTSVDFGLFSNRDLAAGFTMPAELASFYLDELHSGKLT